ncbi:MAG: 7-cyano-7-deazaguanine synthase [Actinomycetota bacterium]|nr:7-cyano-7-deazaguanine synthase [Actinomycetota bacterium]
MLSYEPLSFDTAADGPRVDWESGFRLDDVHIAFGLGATLTPRLSDLLDIAMAAYVTDRLRPRRTPRTRGGDAWSRRLPVRIAVRDAAFWRSREVHGDLHDLLGWLTDDDWEFEFTSGHQRPRFAESQLSLFSDHPAPGARFGLFSGGLDSFLGAARDVADDDRELVLVSARTSNPMGAMQQRTLAALRAAAHARLRGLLVPIGLRADTIRRLTGRSQAPEASQRTRGMIFLVLGAVAAVTGGARELRVYENGVGAMNLPLTEAQYGSRNTRAMRPETLVMAARLVSRVAEAPFSIVNPSFVRTKAEMCAQAPAAFRDAVTRTVSCDTGLTHRASRVPLCGTCTSCLLRRQAMRAAGLRDRDDAEAPRYRVDVRQLDEAGDERLQRLHYMLNQAAQFDRALSAADPRRALAQAFPDLRSIRSALDEQGYADPVGLTEGLLARYTAEWRGFKHLLTGRYLPARGREDLAA